VCRGKPMCMSQYNILFGSARIPTVGTGLDEMKTCATSTHIVVLCEAQFYWFDILDGSGKVLLSEKELRHNLASILKNAKATVAVHGAQTDQALGVATCDKRSSWAKTRQLVINKSAQNEQALQLVDEALFVLCLDRNSPATGTEAVSNMLHGSYELDGDAQVGSCLNRWFDKMQLIVCENGVAGMYLFYIYRRNTSYSVNLRGTTLLTAVRLFSS
jgi:carnitine O-acetyltransferase